VMAPASGLLQGAYVLKDGSKAPDVVLIGTGSEVQLCVAAQVELEKQGISARVVSMPCMELFRSQPADYQKKVLPEGPPRVSIEAGVTFGWREWLGARGTAIGIDRYGASAPAEVNLEKLGITAARVVQEAKALLGK
jgi:transketolase